MIIPTPRKIEHLGKETQIDGIKVETNLKNDEKEAVNELIRTFGAGEGSYRLKSQKRSKYRLRLSIRNETQRGLPQSKKFSWNCLGTS